MKTSHSPCWYPLTKKCLELPSRALINQRYVYKLNDNHQIESVPVEVVQFAKMKNEKILIETDRLNQVDTILVPKTDSSSQGKKLTSLNHQRYRMSNEMNEACNKQVVEIDSAEGLCCPPKNCRIWIAHPRIYLPVVNGSARCYYCGTLCSKKVK